MTSIAERLRDARGEILRNEVCKAVGISLNALMMYETGNRIPRDEIKVKIARVLKTSIEALFFTD